ncbi:MAG: DUF917 domain-containing protein [Saccharofermentanales bacterium]
MSKFVLKNAVQAEDFIRGCTFFGTGGGGDYAEGVKALVQQLDKGNEIGWIDADVLEDDAFCCCPFLMGSIAPETPEVKREREVLYGLGDQTIDNTEAMVRAVKALEELKGEKAVALIPIELGGGNTGACIAAAAELGIAVTNGDYTGRAIPEIQQTTPYIFEKELLPIASVDCWENVAAITSAVNWRMAERIGKMISAGGYSKCAQAGFFFSVKDMKSILVRNTLTESYNVGKALREAAEKGEDPALAAIKEVGGWVVFRGTVTERETEDRQGYFWGINTIAGEGDFEGHELKVWFKNENHVSWFDGKPFITSPDMIQVIDAETGHPFTNNKIKKGMRVSVIGMPARKEFTSERGLSILSAKVFDFDLPFVPVEELIKDYPFMIK